MKSHFQGHRFTILSPPRVRGGMWRERGTVQGRDHVYLPKRGNHIFLWLIKKQHRNAIGQPTLQDHGELNTVLGYLQALTQQKKCCIQQVSQSNAALVTSRAWFYQAESANSLNVPQEEQILVPWPQPETLKPEERIYRGYKIERENHLGSRVCIPVLIPGNLFIPFNERERNGVCVVHDTGKQ